MKNIKITRIIAFFMAVFMILPMVPAMDLTVFAEGLVKDNVTIFDESGKKVTSLTVWEDPTNPTKKTKLRVHTNLEGDIAYKWQISFEKNPDEWADILGAESEEISIGAAMLEMGKAVYFRCVCTSAEKSVASDKIAITLTDTPVINMAETPVQNADSSSLSPINDGDNSFSIIINYVFDGVGGAVAAPAWTVSLKEGHPRYELNVVSPTVTGYKPDQDKITATIENINQNYTYNVIYTPDYVNYTVNHWFQNADNDNYSYNPSYPSETKTGLTGSTVPGDLAKTETGFYSLLYDYTLTLAADGTTVLNIYYDREYVKVKLDLDGGYGVEPIYARYGVVINKDSMIPEKIGYSFNGWSPALPDTVPAVEESYSHVAQWEEADTTYAVAFWYENANDNNYTYVGNTIKVGTTGSTVSGSIADYNNATTTDIPGKDTVNFSELAKADTNVVVKADGSTVVNVYIKRRMYTLKYMEFVCPHTKNQHGTECCTLQHTSHLNTCCTLSQHPKHTTGCVSNLGGKVTNSNNQNELTSNASSTANGTLSYFEVKLGSWVLDTYYCVLFDGTWYHLSGTAESIDWSSSCPRYTHDHSSGWNNTCNTSNCPGLHDHSSGRISSCNTSSCSHVGKAYAGCACWGTSAQTTEGNWKTLNTYTVKFEGNVDTYHNNNLTSAGYRFVPEKNAFFSSIGFGAGPYGNGTAVGAFASMPACDVTFRRKADGGYYYHMTHMLESVDGSGTSYTSRAATTSSDTGKTFSFITGTDFMCRMGGVYYIDEFSSSCPTGFRLLEATYGTESNPTQYVFDKSISSNPGNTSASLLYHNFYYLRKVYKLQYVNPISGQKTTVDMKFEQPLTSAFNVTAESLGFTNDNEGLEFKGWYLDPACNVPAVFDGTTIMPNAGEEGSIGLALYAKWDYKLHTINVYEKKSDETPTSVNTSTHGTVISNPPADPTREGMQFIGWFYMENGVERGYDFSIPVYKDLNLYPKYVSTEMTKVIIYYRVKGTGTDVALATETSGLIGTTKTFEAKTGGDLYDSYTEGYFPDVQSHNVEFVDANTVIYTFEYVEREAVNYKVNHHYTDSNGNAQTITEQGSSKSAFVMIYRNNAELSAYIADAVSKKLILSSDEALNVVDFYYEMPQEDDIVPAPVQVIHQTQNVANSNYTETVTYPINYVDIKTGETKWVSETIMDIPGFTFSLPESIAHSTYVNTPRVDGNTFGADLTYLGLELVLCYTRNEYPYEFRFVDQGGNELMSPVNGKAKYQDSVSYTAPAINGYRLYSAGTESIRIDIEDGETAVKNVFTFYYTEDQVTIKYSATNGGSVSRSEETIYSITGVPKGSTATVNEYYEFDGWYYNGSIVDSELTFVPDKTGEVYINATYIASFSEKKVTIRYEAKGNGKVSNPYEELYILSGSTSGSTAIADPGYKFVGWYTDEGCTNQITPVSATIQPSKTSGDPWVDGTTYYAKFVEDTATFTYNFGVGGGVSRTSETVYRVNGNPAGSKATSEPGYSFVGWYLNGTLVSTNSVLMPEKQDGLWTTSTYEARFEEQEVTITYVRIGPEGADYGSLTSYSETVKAKTQEVSGSTASVSSNLYRFVGWFDNEACSGDPISTNAFFKPDRVAGLNVSATYYAKFEYNLTQLMLNVSTNSDCSLLINIKGKNDSVDLDIIVPSRSNGVVVDGLIIGNTYTITIDTDWTKGYNWDKWSYDNTSGDGFQAEIELVAQPYSRITFHISEIGGSWLTGGTERPATSNFSQITG